ncbi:hypothetical protein AXW83_20130 [Bosea sp. PAMC 26642]|nr:hypothetical protein AXW83_20130 [Bosea sp. PAMC 26642]
MDAFEKANFELMRRISRRVDRYLPYQHAGFYFVDHDGSEVGKARSKKGLHIHAVVVVHPAWKKRFEAAFDAKGFSGDIHMEKLNGATTDVQRVTEYACKGVLWKTGFVKGGYDEFGLIGPKSDWKDGTLQVVKPRRHKALTVQSATAS